MDTNVLVREPEPGARDQERTILLPGPIVTKGTVQRDTHAGAPIARHRRPVTKILLVTTTLAAVACAVTAGAFGVRNVELRREIARNAGWRAATADSMRLARDYHNLLGEIFDLQQELRARQTAQIPPLVTFRTQGEGIGALLGARVVPDRFRFEPTQEERELARAALARGSTDDLRAQLYAQQDVLDSGALAPLAVQGAKVGLRRGERSGPTNTIVYGTGVPVRDVVDVAYRLIASGILVRRIRYSTNPADQQTIQLFHSQQVAEWPELTVNELSRFAAAGTPQ